MISEGLDKAITEELNQRITIMADKGQYKSDKKNMKPKQSKDKPVVK